MLRIFCCIHAREKRQICFQSVDVENFGSNTMRSWRFSSWTFLKAFKVYVGQLWFIKKKLLTFYTPLGSRLNRSCKERKREFGASDWLLLCWDCMDSYLCALFWGFFARAGLIGCNAMRNLWHERHRLHTKEILLTPNHKKRGGKKLAISAGYLEGAWPLWHW